MAVKRSPFEFSSADGALRLYAEVREPADAHLNLLCLHGLTRNGADFEALAARLSLRHRVVVADQRGRGRSQWDADAANYHPLVYVHDMFRLLDELAIGEVVLIGTSMGGIMSLIMAATRPERVRAIVLNDIGPEVPAAGLERLRESLNTSAPSATWGEAAQRARLINGPAFPDYDERDWEAFARRTCVEDAQGRPVPAYDPRILEALNRPSAPALDLWPQWTQLGSKPVLVLRGELSDLLSAEIVARMAAQHPGLRTATVPNRGHAPMLDEPVASAAIESFLAEIEP